MLDGIATWWRGDDDDGMALVQRDAVRDMNRRVRQAKRER